MKSLVLNSGFISFCKSGASGLSAETCINKMISTIIENKSSEFPPGAGLKLSYTKGS